MHFKQYMTRPQMTWLVRTSFFSFGCRFEPSLKFFIVGVGSALWLAKWKQLDNLYKHSETEEMRKKKLRVKINQNRDFFYFCKKKLKSYWLATYSIWVWKIERFIISDSVVISWEDTYMYYTFSPNLGKSIQHGRGLTTQTWPGIE